MSNPDNQRQKYSAHFMTKTIHTKEGLLAVCGECAMEFTDAPEFAAHLAGHELKKETTPKPKCGTICPHDGPCAQCGGPEVSIQLHYPNNETRSFCSMDCMNQFLKEIVPPPAKPPKPPSILLEAEELIHGERRKEYGPVGKSFAQVAKLWSVVFGIEVTPKQVALAMGCLKLQRELHKHKRDNLRDYAGYMALAQQIEDEGEGKA